MTALAMLAISVLLMGYAWPRFTAGLVALLVIAVVFGTVLNGLELPNSGRVTVLGAGARPENRVAAVTPATPNSRSGQDVARESDRSTTHLPRGRRTDRSGEGDQDNPEVLTK